MKNGVGGGTWIEVYVDVVPDDFMESTEVETRADLEIVANMVIRNTFWPAKLYVPIPPSIEGEGKVNGGDAYDVSDEDEKDGTVRDE
ncbi:hypothetical protein M5689_012784 [Euphorbia peplus]|nr:hypothetical protein M5689_012784 [Euphorbia peplus]